MRAELGTPLLKQLSQREQVELQRLNKEVNLLREQAASMLPCDVQHVLCVRARRACSGFAEVARKLREW